VCVVTVVASFQTSILETSSRTTSCWVNMRSRRQCRNMPYQSSWPRGIWWPVHRLVSVLGRAVTTDALINALIN